MTQTVPTLSISEGGQRLAEIRRDPLYPHHISAKTDDLGGFAMLAINALSVLRSQKDGLGRGSEFDGNAARILHERLHVLPPYVTEDAGFWRWLAIEYGADLVEHRYRGQTLAGLANFGLGPRWDSYFRRLWFRADIAHEPSSSSPYQLALRGDVDFWVSGIFRHRYGSARSLCRAFLKYAYPDPDRPRRDRWQLEGQNDRDKGVRVVYKRLRELHAKVAYEVVSEEQCTEFIKMLACDLPL